MPTPFVPGENVAMLEIMGTTEGVPWENTLYFKKNAAIPTANLLLLCNTLGALWLDQAKPILPNVCTVIQVYGTDLTNQTAPTQTGTDDMPWVGDQTGEPLPRNDSLAISFRTASRGRSGRGRNYWPCFTGTQVVNSLVEATTANAIVALYATMVGNNALLTDWTWGVFSRRQNNAWRTEGLFQEITQVLVVDRLVDSQRGRLK
jgi:hypothetical protein